MPQATKESFARALETLVRKYEADRDTYISSEYNETQTRTQFISPLLEALGWDARNEAGVPYHLCEVWEEKGETQGRPDYTLRINGQTKFFLEAKSPSEELPKADILQTKRYAWNSRDIFFAGVCDFEQFAFWYSLFVCLQIPKWHYTGCAESEFIFC
ncbi:MAG: type I restriction endonuclease [Candidatus Acidiferrales bacterium]